MSILAIGTEIVVGTWSPIMHRCIINVPAASKYKIMCTVIIYKYDNFIGGKHDENISLMSTQSAPNFQTIHFNSESCMTYTLIVYSNGSHILIKTEHIIIIHMCTNSRALFFGSHEYKVVKKYTVYHNNLILRPTTVYILYEMEEITKAFPASWRSTTLNRWALMSTIFNLIYIMTCSWLVTPGRWFGAFYTIRNPNKVLW